MKANSLACNYARITVRIGSLNGDGDEVMWSAVVILARLNLYILA